MNKKYLLIYKFFFLFLISDFILSESFQASRLRNHRLLKKKQQRRGKRGADDEKGYVPDGLTPEEYAQIKKREQQELASKDFGAFGPRFKKSSRPQGDWFLAPTLWTSGFQLSEINGASSGPPSLGARIKAVVTFPVLKLLILRRENKWLRYSRKTALRLVAGALCTLVLWRIAFVLLLKSAGRSL
jgi:hypothetical protein